MSPMSLSHSSARDFEKIGIITNAEKFSFFEILYSQPLVETAGTFNMLQACMHNY